MTHELFIREAYRLAQESVTRGDHPFGALLVCEGEIVLRAHNTVHADQDVTRHAELNLVSLASNKFPSEYLQNCTLYTSTEPCIMCCGGIFWANIREIVFGVRSKSLSEIAGGDFVIPSPTIFGQMKPVVKVTGPVLEEEGMKAHHSYWSSYQPPTWRGDLPKKRA